MEAAIEKFRKRVGADVDSYENFRLYVSVYSSKYSSKNGYGTFEDLQRSLRIESSSILQYLLDKNLKANSITTVELPEKKIGYKLTPETEDFLIEILSLFGTITGQELDKIKPMT